ncbi:hypothetical protein EJ04DRAFT_571821 [Polyplosphaeria fusca]|uniref:Uncharacterized protein n=1 Tax=Polyplosphaeria fusca TaxID=682080 RepID=A0A9P4V8Z0_9PLEO|nr:hypothetical protein EJ04DRAFT_571821 [Polyplosphaeria fusca]
MSGEKKGSDLSARLKRPGKVSSRTSPPSISTPPKAAIGSSKGKKEELHRRKNPFNEMLLHKHGKDTSGSSTSATEEQEELRADKGHGRNPSIGSIKSISDERTANRIAELERALIITREEQNALREELDKVKQHDQAYRETIEDYHRQLHSHNHGHHSRPHSPDTDMVVEYGDRDGYENQAAYDRRGEDAMDQTQHLRQKLAELQERLVEQDVGYRLKLQQQAQQALRGESEWNELTRRLHHAEKESTERLQQLMDLKQSISSLTRMESQVADSDLSEQMDLLYHRIREWVISNFRRTKLDFSNLTTETARMLESIHPDPTQMESSDRLSFYQSIISSKLMQIFNEPIMIGLPKTGPLAPVTQIAAYIHDVGHDYREWRRATVLALHRSGAASQIDAEKKELLHAMVNDIKTHLSNLTSVTITPAAMASLSDIFCNSNGDTAYAAAAEGALQGAQTVLFDDSLMENINGDDMDDVDTFTKRELAFCVFPCLEKFGDEAGEHLDVSNVLLKAKINVTRYCAITNTMAPTRAGLQGVKRKRGRPSNASSAGATRTKQPRDREPKSSTISKKRGRPKKSGERSLSEQDPNRPGAALSASQSKEQGRHSDKDQEAETVSSEPTTRYASLVTKTKRVTQDAMERWPDITQQMLRQIIEILEVAKVEAVNTRRDDRRMHEANEIINNIIARVVRELSTSRVPPSSKEEDLNKNKLNELNHRMHHDFMTARHSVQLLAKRVEEAKLLLKADERKRGRLQRETEKWRLDSTRRERQARVHPLLAEEAQGTNDRPEDIALKARTTERLSWLEGAESDPELGDVLEQLRKSLETMQGNHAQMDGIGEAVLHAQAVLDGALFTHASAQQYTAL